MQIRLANAKIMFEHSEVKPLSVPMFQSIANDLAMEMASCDIDTLAKELDCSRKLAAGNWQRYQNFFNAEKIPAIMAYNGQAYKLSIASSQMTASSFICQQKSMSICLTGSG